MLNELKKALGTIQEIAGRGLQDSRTIEAILRLDKPEEKLNVAVKGEIKRLHDKYRRTGVIA